MPLAGAALDYLRARRCAIPPADGDLRWLPGLSHPFGYRGPALLGLVTDALTARPMSLHMTWIQADGRKANVNPPRLYLKDHAKSGGVVRLWPDDGLTAGLCVAEGIETALTLAHAHQPAWACLDAGNLGQLAVIPGVGCLVIAADNDPAGIAAAEACATRWVEAGRSVRIVKSDRDGFDLNDEVRAWTA